MKSESINEYSFFRKLETGILLCKHANTVTLHAEEFTITNPNHPVLNRLKVPQKQVRFNEVSVIDLGLLDFVNPFKIWVGLVPFLRAKAVNKVRFTIKVKVKSSLVSHLILLLP